MYQTILNPQPTGSSYNPYKKYGLQHPSEQLGWETKTPAQQQKELRQFREMGPKAKKLTEDGITPELAAPIAASEVLSLKDTGGRNAGMEENLRVQDKLMKQASRGAGTSFVPQSATSAQSIPSPMLEDARAKLKKFESMSYYRRPPTPQ